MVTPGDYGRAFEPTVTGHAPGEGRLAAFSWDEEELLDLEVRHISAVLARFVDGEIDATEVTEWADTVDLRDDLGREPGRETQINDALFALSSPELQDEDLEATVRRVLADLRHVR